MQRRTKCACPCEPTKAACGENPSDTDRDRVEHLFGLYEKLVAPLEADAEKQNKRYARRVKRGAGD